MSLYKDFFYKVSYGLDNVTDAQPNYLQIDIYANPDVYLNDYYVNDINADSSKEQIVLHLKSYINLDRRVRQHWNLNTVLTESIADFFEEKKNQKDYGYTFAKKYNKTPVKDLNDILKIVLKDYENNKSNTDNMSHYLVRNYHAQKNIIAQELKKISSSLEKTIKEKTITYIKNNGAIGIDIPINYEKDDNKYFSVPFYLGTSEYLSKIKLNKDLTQHLTDKKVSLPRVKI